MKIRILKYCSKKKRTGRGSTGSFLAFVQMEKYIVKTFCLYLKKTNRKGAILYYHIYRQMSIARPAC